jgi:hypothetical protein
MEHLNDRARRIDRTRGRARQRAREEHDQQYP